MVNIHEASKFILNIFKHAPILLRHCPQAACASTGVNKRRWWRHARGLSSLGFQLTLELPGNSKAVCNVLVTTSMSEN